MPRQQSLRSSFGNPISRPPWAWAWPPASRTRACGLVTQPRCAPPRVLPGPPRMPAGFHAGRICVSMAARASGACACVCTARPVVARSLARGVTCTTATASADALLLAGRRSGHVLTKCAAAWGRGACRVQRRRRAGRCRSGALRASAAARARLRLGGGLALLRKLRHLGAGLALPADLRGGRVRRAARAAAPMPCGTRSPRAQARTAAGCAG
jgi:hypothetical protein